MVLVNVLLFVPVALGGTVASWFGWRLAGRGEDDGDGPISAGPDDLARSA